MSLNRYQTGAYERAANDFYPTPSWVTELLTNTVRLRGTVWEPCVGQGALAKVIAAAGYGGDRHGGLRQCRLPGRLGCRCAAGAAAGRRADDRDEYIEVFYNQQRRHSSVGYRTPAQARIDMTMANAA